MHERKTRARRLADTQGARSPYLFVGGLDIESDSHATLQITNPPDGTIIGRCPDATPRDVDKAVQTAQAAFEDGWPNQPEETRRDILWSLAELIDQDADDLAILESLQTGMTFREALRQVKFGAQVLRGYARWAPGPPGEAHRRGVRSMAVVYWQPHPVVAACLPWQEPFAAATRRLGAAIAVGTTLILNPPNEAPLTVLKLAALTRETGLPSGVLNVLTGGRAVQEALALHPDVSVLLYGGAIDVARHLLVATAKSNLKPAYFELGDKPPCIIFEDADRKAAINAITRSIFTARCIKNTAVARLLVDKTVYHDVIKTVTARAKQINVGHPLDEHTELGPMITEAHLKRVLAYVELGRREGAKLVAGGQRDVEGQRAHGYFVAPTVFLDVKPTSRLATEEISGPVLSIMPFRNEDEALSIANHSDYGRAASVWTQDLNRAQRVARKLNAGVIWTNQLDIQDLRVPVAGTHLSGHGHELGRLTLEQMCRTKSIFLPGGS